jgi:preprotein translocase subunit SecD
MKTLAEILRDADPVASEPTPGTEERRARRRMLLEASQARDEARRGRVALATVVALAIAAIAVSALQWSRTVVDVVAAVRFEARLAEENPAPGLREAVIAGTDRKVYLHAGLVVANSDIVQASVVQDDRASTFGVSLTFGADGAAKMLRATRAHLGRPIAILLDGEVVSAPVVRAPVTESAIISGSYSKAEAERIVDGIVGR